MSLARLSQFRKAPPECFLGKADYGIGDLRLPIGVWFLALGLWSLDVGALIDSNVLLILEAKKTKNQRPKTIRNWRFIVGHQFNRYP
jgi:hypothetical protein